MSSEQQNVHMNNFTNAEIVIDELKLHVAIKSLKSNKAVGIDQLPAEIL